MDIASSTNHVPIRLTDERWNHIVSARDELAGYYDDCLRTLEEPDVVLAGHAGSRKAVKNYGRNPTWSWFIENYPSTMAS